MKMKIIQYILITAIALAPLKGHGAAWFNRIRQIASMDMQQSRPTIRMQAPMFSSLPAVTKALQSQEHVSLYSRMLQRLAAFKTGWYNSDKTYHNSHQHTPYTLGFTLFGFTLWGLGPEFDNKATMEEKLNQSSAAEQDAIALQACNNPLYFAPNDLLQRYNRYDALKKIFEHKPDTQARFIKVFIEQFPNVDPANRHDYYALISKLMEQNPTCIEAFIPLILDNFGLFCHESPETIRYMLKAHPETALAVARHAAKNFEAFIKYNSQQLELIIKHCPEAAAVLTSQIIQHLPKLINCNLIELTIKHNPQAAAHFVQAIIDQFSIYATNYESCCFIAAQIEADRNVAILVSSEIENNIETLLGSPAGVHLVQTTMKSNPAIIDRISFHLAKNIIPLLEKNYGNCEIFNRAIAFNSPSGKIIAQAAVSDLKNILSLAGGRILIDNMLLSNSCSATVIIEYIADNFSNLLKSKKGRKLIWNAITYNDDACASFLQPAIDNFSILAIDKDFGIPFINRFITKHPEAAKSFAQPVLDNAAYLVNSNLSTGKEIITLIITHYPAIASRFTPFVIEHFIDFAKDRYGLRLIKTLIASLENNPETLDALENIAQLRQEKFSKMSYYDMSHSEIKTKDAIDKLLENISKIRIQTHITKLIEGYLTVEYISTQSTQHFKTLLDHNIEKLRRFFPKQKNHSNAFSNMIETILSTEQREQEKGNYTFVHAYPWNIHFLQDLDAHLRPIALHTFKQPVSLRFTKQPNRFNARTYAATRETLLAEGAQRYYASEGNKQKHMIFMNYALLTNQSGSNTLQYVAKNYCENPPKLLLDKVFKHLNLETYHIKYQKEIEELQTLHRGASAFGAGILFSFTPEMLQKSVYVCSGGGVKREVNIEGIGKTDDVKLILDTLRTSPEKIEDIDHLEFVFVVTKDCALNPNVVESEAYKAIPFNAADPEKWALYEVKRDELVAKIAVDVQAERAKWNQTQTTEFKAILQQMDEWNKKYNCLNDCGSRLQE